MTWTEPLQHHAASSHRSPDLGVVDAFDMPIKHLNQILSTENRSRSQHPKIEVIFGCMDVHGVCSALFVLGRAIATHDVPTISICSSENQ